MKKLLFITITVLLGLASSSPAGEDSSLFAKGKRFARTGQTEFAYMQYRNIVNNYARSRHREHALFSIGEYYASIPDPLETRRVFQQFLDEYPDSKLKIFALTHLYTIAELDEDTELMDKLKTEIITIQQVGFVFRDSKELEYLSALSNHYRALIQIDRIRIEKEGKILVELTY